MTLMLLPSVSVFPAMLTRGRPEGGSVHDKDQHTEREQDDYSKLLCDSVIVAAAKAL